MVERVASARAEPGIEPLIEVGETVANPSVIEYARSGARAQILAQRHSSPLARRLQKLADARGRVNHPVCVQPYSPAEYHCSVPGCTALRSVWSKPPTSTSVAG